MEILIRPIITEKFTELGEKMNRYGFIVHKNANKLQIKKAVEDLYRVKVEAVNTIRYTGKNKSRNTKSGIIAGRTASVKKAIITVAGEEKIDFYSNI
ncbi:MAG TPA: 50S ribosomal protein L23 [Bacteroidales bacterium]|nr:50S ribosomal protein L23 [Bacteroidales bacterium]HPR57148.1 50S ribosomal protein L23 [Bacteroidales bacterium]HRW97573.1 50S ribosomal protein L23 [Bacteroidales bacterium]